MKKSKTIKPKYELGQEVQVLVEGHARRAVVTHLEAYGYPHNNNIGYYCILKEPSPRYSGFWLNECSVYPLTANLTEVEVLNGEIGALCELSDAIDKLIQIEYDKISALEARKRIAEEQRCTLRKQLDKAEKALRKEHK